MSQFEVIIYEKFDNVAHITLNRPKALNAYNIKMRDELYEVLGAIKDDPDVDVVILKAAGEKAFCTGGQLNSRFGKADEGDPAVAYAELLDRIVRFSKPTIARVKGACLAGGMGLMLACDIAIAAEDFLAETR